MIALTVSLTVGVPAWAQESAADRAASFRAAGRRAANAGHHAEAVQAWRAAWEFKPGDPGLACDVGRGELVTRNDVEAAVWMETCVALMAPKLGPDTLDRTRKEVTDRAIARSRVVTLRFELEPGSEVSINGKSVGRAPFSAPTFVKPGEHWIEVRKGDRSAERTLTGRAGEEHKISLKLPPPPSSAVPQTRAEPSPAPRRAKPSFFWLPAIVGGSAAITAAGAGAVFYALADITAREQSDAKKAALQATDQVGCGRLRHDACDTFTSLDSRRVFLVDAATGAIIAASVLGTATLGYAAFEKDRVSLSVTVGGITGRFTW